MVTFYLMIIIMFEDDENNSFKMNLVVIYVYV